MNGAQNLAYEKDGIESIAMRDNSTDTVNNNNIEGNNYNEIIPPNSGFIQTQLEKHRAVIKGAIIATIHILVAVYFGFATHHFVYEENNNYYSTINNETGRCYGKCGFQYCNGYGMLMLLIIFIYWSLFYYYILKPTIGRNIHRAILKPTGKLLSKLFENRYVSFGLVILVIVAIGVFLKFETAGNSEKLKALVAPAVFIVLGFVFSTNRTEIKWRTVVVGIVCQFLLGVICIRWEVGRNIFKCLGDKVAEFLKFSDDGSRFVFGNDIVDQQIFAFAILPVIFFFSFFISLLYYLGTMQWVVMKLGWTLQVILGTTVCESVTSAANIFLGMSESPLLIRPYIKLLTKSEIHSIMVSGFATTSGTVLAAYMSFGASPAHLITSSVMAAPATLAMSKLFLPETEKSLTASDNMKLEKSEDSSLLDAASNGASSAIPIILGIIANIVAFVAFIAFLNAVVNWIGYLVGWDEITFEWLFSKLFIPLAWAIGIENKDCDIIAKVIASKTIINEFVAYERLGVYKENKDISLRSAGIATFAICGFANPSSLGILIGSLGAMAPNRRQLITSVAIRAFVVGSIVCFMSASIAGMLMDDEELERSYRMLVEQLERKRNKSFV